MSLRRRHARDGSGDEAKVAPPSRNAKRSPADPFLQPIAAADGQVRDV